jgi:putative spermidine/putrescine transport system permease protein
MIAQLLIQQVIELTNWPFAAIICLLLLATALAIFWGYDRAVGLSTLAGEQRVSATRSAPARLLGRWMQGGAWMLGDAIALVARRVGSGYLTPTASAPLRALAVLILIFLILPLAFLAPISVSTRGYVAWPPQGFTWMWYANVLASPLWTAAAIRSFIVALLTALVCFLIAVPAAFAFLRLSGRTAAALFALIVSPLIVPRMVIAIALFYVYARLGLVGSTLGLVIGHAIIALPFFFVAVIAALKTYDRRLDAAAASLGAGPWRTARLITLPLIGTGLLSATLFAFVISFDELNVALFASGGLQSTLPKLMWDEATLRFSPVLAAVSTLLLAVMSVVVLIAARLQSAGQE